MKPALKILKWLFILGAFGYFIYAAFLAEVIEYNRIIDTFSLHNYSYFGETLLEQRKKYKLTSFKSIMALPDNNKEMTTHTHLSSLKGIDADTQIMVADNLVVLTSPKFKLIVVYEWLLNKQAQIKMTYMKNRALKSQIIAGYDSITDLKLENEK